MNIISLVKVQRLCSVHFSIHLWSSAKIPRSESGKVETLRSVKYFTFVKIDVMHTNPTKKLCTLLLFQEVRSAHAEMQRLTSQLYGEVHSDVASEDDAESKL